MTEKAVSVQGLRIVTTDGSRCLIDDGNLELDRGEVLGVVGESGSGKTTLGLGLLHYCRRGLRVDAGTIRIGGRNLWAQGPRQLRKMRGRIVCYVPQDPASALNPALRIRTQLAECLPRERRGSALLLKLLAEVKLPDAQEFLDRFPHQLSGGQLQRVALAMAFANRPTLVVLDEPTTSLDVTTQAHVLQTIRELCERNGVAAIYVSHDIAVVAAIAQRVAVVYAGRIVEIGPTAKILQQAAHPYTRALMLAVPDVHDAAPLWGIPGQAPEPGAVVSGCGFAPRCRLAAPICRERLPDRVEVAPLHEVRCLRAGDRGPIEARHPVPARQYAAAPSVLVVERLRASYDGLEVLHGVSLQVSEGECVALVGESGSGKTTLARCIAGLHDHADGSMLFKEKALALDGRLRSVAARRRIQTIFQNPYRSFNPRRSIGTSLSLALAHFEKLTDADRRLRVQSVLEQVSLPAALAESYPRDLSGGQRQRAAIARALICDPDLLICDEITSALDVSVQAVIIELLRRLQRDRGLAMLFVTHNLAVIRGVAQRICVMHGGCLVEDGPTDEVMRRPRSEETHRLLRDAPRLLTNPRETFECL